MIHGWWWLRSATTDQGEAGEVRVDDQAQLGSWGQGIWGVVILSNTWVVVISGFLKIRNPQKMDGLFMVYIGWFWGWPYFENPPFWKTNRGYCLVAGGESSGWYSRPRSYNQTKLVQTPRSMETGAPLQVLENSSLALLAVMIPYVRSPLRQARLTDMPRRFRRAWRCFDDLTAWIAGWWWSTVQWWMEVKWWNCEDIVGTADVQITSNNIDQLHDAALHFATHLLVISFCASKPTTHPQRPRANATFLVA